METIIRKKNQRGRTCYFEEKKRRRRRRKGATFKREKN
jgi:hypothetical protein